jgi:hypothetical protein
MNLPILWVQCDPEVITALFSKRDSLVQISGIGIQGRVNNNRMERYHGTFKERSKVMRAIKKPDSLIQGQRIYYDYIRPHMGLDGKTPAEAAGINLDLSENKWESLIKKAKAEVSAK